jgi:uncharacterized protein (DUF302 family)
MYVIQCENYLRNKFSNFKTNDILEKRYIILYIITPKNAEPLVLQHPACPSD